MKALRHRFVAFLASWFLSTTEGARFVFQPPSSAYPSSLIDLHRSLVERPSVTGSEGEVSTFLESYLQEKGFTVELQNVGHGRDNVLAYLRDSRKTRVLVTSHIDTVPPFLPYERRGDEIWGRGSVDAKGSVASQIIAVEELAEAGKISEGDVALLFVIGEEKGGPGMRDVNDLGLSWEAVIFGEPTELKLGRGHKGGLGFTIRVKGKTGHSGYPDQGRNAIDILVRALSAIENIELPWSEEFGNTTINVGSIEGGGIALNVIPDEASAAASVRISTGTPESVSNLIENTVLSISPYVEITFGPGRGPVPLDYDIEGFETAVLNYGTDVPSLKGGHKRYLYGPGSILVAHSDHEHLKISDLEAAVEGYKLLISETLRRNTEGVSEDL